jgi:hypothetical protein
MMATTWNPYVDRLIIGSETYDVVVDYSSAAGTAFFLATTEDRVNLLPLLVKA